MSPVPLKVSWIRKVLNCFCLFLHQRCCVNRGDELSEAVPEEVKNLLLIMAKEGILVPEWRDDNDTSIWDATWRKARAISFSLDPEILKSWMSQPQLEVAG